MYPGTLCVSGGQQETQPYRHHQQQQQTYPVPSPPLPHQLLSPLLLHPVPPPLLLRQFLSPLRPLSVGGHQEDSFGLCSSARLASEEEHKTCPALDQSIRISSDQCALGGASALGVARFPVDLVWKSAMLDRRTDDGYADTAEAFLLLLHQPPPPPLPHQLLSPLLLHPVPPPLLLRQFLSPLLLHPVPSPLLLRQLPSPLLLHQPPPPPLPSLVRYPSEQVCFGTQYGSGEPQETRSYRPPSLRERYEIGASEGKVRVQKNLGNDV